MSEEEVLVYKKLGQDEMEPTGTDGIGVNKNLIQLYFDRWLNYLKFNVKSE